jgi:hypothetical protein
VEHDAEHEQVERAIARRSMQIYLPIALGAALLFWLAAGPIGGYPLVAQLGGTVWVGLLSLIVSMPLVTARVKRRQRADHAL